MMRFFICMAAAIAMAPVQAQAQSYPNKPVRIMVGFAPGGIADEMGRYLGDFLARETGNQGIVENRTGAAGIPALVTQMRELGLLRGAVDTTGLLDPRWLPAAP